MLPSDRVLQHQYRVQNYQYYADIIRDLLQAKNHHQRNVRDVVLPEIHHNEQNSHKSNFSKDKNPKKNGKSVKRRHNMHMSMQLAKMMEKDAPLFKEDNVKCKTCVGFKYTAEKCCTLKHLVALYQKSLGNDNKAQGLSSGYEAHFTILTD
jgi:hypothetical protein